MKQLTKENTKYYSEPFKFYEDLIKDIKSAKKNIRIETFRFGEKIAEKIRDELIKRAKRGVEVKLLIDHWGADIGKDFFKELESAGGEVKYFRKLKLTIKLISYNNRRDHRKIAIIDDEITYIGSANITNHCKDWREFILRIKEPRLAEKMIEIFEDNYKIHNFFLHSIKKHIKPIKIDKLEIVRDAPSIRFQRIKNKHIHQIRRAKKEVIIETPYFVPDLKTLIALVQTAKKGIEIKLVIPKESDVRIVDVFAQSLYGKLHKRGIKIYFYTPGFNHSKLSMIDNKIVSFGSSNFDYRSFRDQYEITIFAETPILREYVENHIKKTMQNTQEFKYEEWKKRPLYKRIFAIIIEPFKHFL